MTGSYRSLIPTRNRPGRFGVKLVEQFCSSNAKKPLDAPLARVEPADARLRCERLDLLTT